jgi:4-amino-4-deoxy-L-arabinose transferase-like glycosyltransferase
MSASSSAPHADAGVAETAAERPTAHAAIQWWEWLLVALITAGGAWLRWRQIGEQGVWLDEAFSIWMARQPLNEMLGWITRIDQHPPLYYALLRPWLAVGESEGAIRSLSALLSTATIPVLWLTGRRLFGPAAAVGAALLLAASPFHLRFAQEMRMYALLVFTVSVALLALVHLLTGARGRGWWAALALFTTLTMLSHNTAVLFPVAMNPAMGGVWLVQRLRGAPNDALRLPTLREWLLAQGAILLLWSPWALAFVRQARAVDAEFWIQPPTGQVITATVLTFFSDWLPGGNEWLWGAIGVALLLGIWGAWRRVGAATLLLLLACIPFAAELLVSLRRPIFYDRTLIWTTLPLLLLAGAGLRLLTPAPGLEPGRGLMRAGGVVAVGAVAALLYGNFLSLENYYDNYRKEEWREAAAWASERVRPHDLVLFNATWVQIPFDYYFEWLGITTTKHGVPVDLFDAGILEPKMTEADLPRLLELIEPHNCVWLVYSHNWYTDPESILPKTLRREMMSRKAQPFNGLEIQLYERRGGGEDCIKRP